jgi:hypothetical protein
LPAVWDAPFHADPFFLHHAGDAGIVWPTMGMPSLATGVVKLL